MTTIITLILAYAFELGVPPYFALAIAYTENSMLDPYLVSKNANGTYDRGIFQLNSGWYTDNDWASPETNILAAMEHIKYLATLNHIDDWFNVAIAYNAGASYSRHAVKPPASSIEYAVKVLELETKLQEEYKKERYAVMMRRYMTAREALYEQY